MANVAKSALAAQFPRFGGVRHDLDLLSPIVQASPAASCIAVRAEKSPLISN